jgi:hypothetical protein
MVCHSRLQTPMSHNASKPAHKERIKSSEET